MYAGFLSGEGFEDIAERVEFERSIAFVREELCETVIELLCSNPLAMTHMHVNL